MPESVFEFIARLNIDTPEGRKEFLDFVELQFGNIFRLGGADAHQYFEMGINLFVPVRGNPTCLKEYYDRFLPMLPQEDGEGLRRKLLAEKLNIETAEGRKEFLDLVEREFGETFRAGGIAARIAFQRGIDSFVDLRKNVACLKEYYDRFLPRLLQRDEEWFLGYSRSDKLLIKLELNRKQKKTLWEKLFG